MDGNQLIEIDASGPLIANDFPTLIGGAVKGMGLAQVPGPIAMERVKLGQLEAVLSEFAPSTPGAFLYYADRWQVLPKLRAFIDHAKEHCAAMPRPDESSQAE